MTRDWKSADRARLWQIGGLAAVLLILVASWLLLLQPQREALLDAQAAADTARTAQAAELTKLRALRADFLEFDDYRDQVAAGRLALPGTDALPDFLRELQAAGVASGVTVTDVGAGTPAAVSSTGAAVEPGTATAGASMYAIVVTIEATGDVVTDAEFLRQLQQVQPRAVLFDTLTMAAAGDDPDGPGDALTPVTLTASLRVFVDTASAAPVPR